MFHNYLITALRNFSRHKLYSFINITGLTVGFTCAVFIILFVRDELSYDRWIPGSNDIYRVEASYYSPGVGYSKFSGVPFTVPIAMQAQIPEVVAETHLIPERVTAQAGARIFSELVDVVDPNFFQVIRLPFAEGSAAAALTRPDSLVLSQMMARKYFGTTDVVGRIMTINGSYAMTVTGVLRDLPHNTHLSADMVIPNTSKADTMPREDKETWTGSDGTGYVQLAPGADPNIVLVKLNPILDRNIDVKQKENLNLMGSQYLKLRLVPFEDIHLISTATGPLTFGVWTNLYGFAAVALLILLIACSNFSNLATASATLRAREVGLRKVMGAQRHQLIAQFLGESVTTALISSVLALALVEILRPFYDRLIGRAISFDYLGDWRLTLFIVVIATGAGLLGGVYPALILSRFRPAAVLGSGRAFGGGPGTLRTALVILQFAVSIGLGIIAIVIFAQMHYARQIDFGFDRKNIVVIRGVPFPPGTATSFVQTLKGDPAILGVSLSGDTPFSGDIANATAQMPDRSEKVTVRTINIDPDFLNVYRIKLLSGRDLSRSRGNDSSAADQSGVGNGRNVLINATAARRFGLNVTNAMGRTIAVTGPTGTAHVTIVGILGDAKFEGLQTEVQPTVFFYDPAGLNWASIRVAPGYTQVALTAIDHTWRRFAPTLAIRRFFLTDTFQDLLTVDERGGTAFDLFVGVAITIAAMGLFGLAAFSTERRTKEIGLRKVFGAKVKDIIWLVLWQFSIPVLVANLIAWPVAYYYLRHWLDGYAYRISLSPLYFISAGAAALAIAWATVIVHAAHVARVNPVHALRYE